MRKDIKIHVKRHMTQKYPNVHTKDSKDVNRYEKEKNMFDRTRNAKRHEQTLKMHKKTKAFLA